ncbi:MAG TPA: GGDEF domain-containing protein [Vicinamibacterales bacterium]|jgi:diguanylate cyclase (GGDEF)-like protein
MGIALTAIDGRQHRGISNWFGWLFLPSAAGAAMALHAQGTVGALWCYPAVAFAYFVLPTRLAGIGSVALLSLCAVMMYRYAGALATVSFVVSLGLVIVLVAAILQVFDHLRRVFAAQAITDPLTGAFNRRHLESCVAAAIERRDRSAESASLLLFDVDRFKEINDELGHGAGDEMLKALVTLVTERARKLDVLFRIGGDEFVLLLPGARYGGALAVAEDIRGLVASSPLLNGRCVSISIGVSELQRDQSASRWIEDADAALAEAKQGGRNRVTGHVFAALESGRRTSPAFVRTQRSGRRGIRR